MFNPFLAPLRERAISQVSPEAGRLVSFGNRHAWDFRVLGRAPVPNAPVLLRNWCLVPVNQDSGLIPAHALARVQAIYQAGLRPRAFILAHEAPKLLAGPPKQPFKLPALKPPIELVEMAKLVWRPLLMAAGTALFVVVVGPLLVKLFVSLILGLLSLLLLPLVLLALATGALVDPALIAITEDGYWVVIDRWWS